MKSKHADDHLIFYSRMNQNAANKIELETKEFELATSQLQTAFCIEDIHKGVVGKVPSIKQIIEKSSEGHDISEMLLRHNKNGGNMKK